MTNAEFSNAFDTLLNSYKYKSELGEGTSIIDIALDEFEKSQFLTLAQEMVITNLYSGVNLNGFEATEQNRRYLDSLVTYVNISFTNKDGADAKYLPQEGLKYYQVDLSSLESELMFITYEATSFSDATLGCGKNKTVQVIPIRQDELTKVVKNPFRGPNTSRVLRVDVGPRKIELISKYTLDTYYLGYISKPTPIILVDLEEDLTINGESQAMECQLDSSLHNAILQMAVELAINSKAPSSAKNK